MLALWVIMTALYALTSFTTMAMYQGPQERYVAGHESQTQVLRTGERIVTAGKRTFAVRVKAATVAAAGGGARMEVWVTAPPSAPPARLLDDGRPPTNHAVRGHSVLVATVESDGKVLRQPVEVTAKAWNWAIGELERGGQRAPKAVFHLTMSPYRSELRLVANTSPQRFSATLLVGNALDTTQWDACAWLLASKLVAECKPPDWRPPPHVVQRLVRYHT